MEPLGDLLRAYRARHGIDQRELGDRLGVGQQMVSKLERGARRPGAALTRDIAALLNVDAAVLAASLVDAHDAHGAAVDIGQQVGELRDAVQQLREVIELMLTMPPFVAPTRSTRAKVTAAAKAPTRVRKSTR